MDLSESYLVGIVSARHASLRMGHCYTDYIDIKSGMKHYVGLCPHSYIIMHYIDDLMEKLLSEELGCVIGDISCGICFLCR